MSLKKLKQGDKCPSDFWNYNINPILGYEYKEELRSIPKEKIKYKLQTNQVR